MGRQLRRVSLDFSWPQNKVWSGFLNHHHDQSVKCTHCAGTGSTAAARHLNNLWYGNGNVPFRPEDRGSKPLTPETPAVRAFAERNVKRDPSFYGLFEEENIIREARRLCSHWNDQWGHHLNADDVKALIDEGRLWEFTHDFIKGVGWKKKAFFVMPTPEEVNTWSIQGFGHDSLNCWIVINAELARTGQEGTCPNCKGEGTTWPREEDKLAYDNWTSTEPPEGEGYQLWETVSEGSPISPVFEHPEDLARWLVVNRDGSIDSGTTFKQWMTFISGPGWAPSMIGTSAGLVLGVQGITDDEDSQEALSYDGYPRLSGPSN